MEEEALVPEVQLLAEAAPAVELVVELAAELAVGEAK